MKQTLADQLVVALYRPLLGVVALNIFAPFLLMSGLLPRSDYTTALKIESALLALLFLTATFDRETQKAVLAYNLRRHAGRKTMSKREFWFPSDVDQPFMILSRVIWLETIPFWLMGDMLVFFNGFLGFGICVIIVLQKLKQQSV